MRYILFVLGFLLSFGSTFSQEDNRKTSFRLYGDIYSDRWMPYQKYIESGLGNFYTNDNKTFYGTTLELSTPSKYNNFNFLLGGTYISKRNDIEYPVSSVAVDENWLKAGGIFTGVEYSPEYNRFGYSLKFKLGYYHVSKTILKYNLTVPNASLVEEYSAGGNLGTSVEFNVIIRFGKFMFTPGGKIIFMGDDFSTIMAPGFSFGMGYDP